MLEFALAAALVWVGVAQARLWRQARAQVAASSADRQLGLARAGTMLGWFVGVNSAGRIAGFRPAPGRKLVAFVVRPATASADIMYWRRVAEALGPQSEARFAGYCESDSCARVAGLPATMMLFRAGEVRATEAVLQADRAGSALAVGANGEIIARLRWRGFHAPVDLGSAIVRLP